VRVLRWGRSAYETDEALALEREGLEALGCTLSHYVGPRPPVEEAQILVVTSKVKVDEAVLSRAPGLRLVLTTTSGHEHLDKPAAAARGVTLARCPLARRDAVVDTSLAMGLSLLRGVPGLHRRSEQGVWARGELPGRRMRLVRGLAVGVVGHGVIGRAAAASWRALGAEVAICDPAQAGTVPWSDLLVSSELVLLHCELTADSERMVDAAALAMMSPGAILVNTARGGLVDLEALVAADHLGGIGLDVFPEEPPTDLAGLARRENTILLPHAAGYHEGLGEAVAREVVDAVRGWMDGGAVPHPVGQ
jgi:phosphoglycerate dehydrogenase-like enzyme